MAVMLRTLGIPSRVVNGFRGGEFNDLTGSYIIRASDAHSWVEAYFPGQGWVSFDPTPPDPKPSAGAWSRMLLYVDALRELWREWVINYDFLHQRKLATSAASGGRHMFDGVQAWARQRYAALLQRATRVQREVAGAPQRWSATGFAVVAALVLLLNLKKLWRAIYSLRVARRPERAPQTAASIWYARMTKAAARRGWRKLPTQTPAEFATTISDLSLRNVVLEFTACYERARFGDSVEDARVLPAIFDKAFSRQINAKSTSLRSQ
jgi:hypothetical protein